MTRPLKGWIVTAQQAAAIVQGARNRRAGIAAACAELGVGAVMVKRHVDLLAYVQQYAQLQDVHAAQTKLEIFRSVERADPVRGNSLREAVFADRLSLREIQMELDDAKIRAGLRAPLPVTLEQVLDQCRTDLPDLHLLRPPIELKAPEGDGLWIGADLEWTLMSETGDALPIWCAMISINIACARIRKGSFFEFMHRVCTAAMRYRVVSIVLASHAEREVLTTTLKNMMKSVETVFCLHTLGALKEMAYLNGRVGSEGDPLSEAVKDSAAPLTVSAKG